MKPLCIIIGFGTGVGLGIAHAFGQAGFQLGLISRHPAKYADVLQDLAAAGIDAAIAAADVSNEKSLEGAIASQYTSKKPSLSRAKRTTAKSTKRT
jgi:NAD(P)-dependent dehydrogenase (short-subunit alcohol dehydrogenase family)